MIVYSLPKERFNRTTTCAAIGLTVACVSLLSIQVLGQSINKELERQHEKYVAAQKSRDYNTVLKLTTSDFVLTTEDGKKIDRKMLEKAAAAKPTEVGGTREQ